MAEDVADANDSREDVGGDPACWAHLVCPGCGRILPDRGADVCPACGTAMEDG
ncbi:MAG TPA: hypothetical protein VF288_01490 [Mycobacteriales bacterium]